MLASVIILNKNKKEQLEKSLPVLLKQDLEEGYEVIVVDNDSTDGSKEYLEKLPIKLVEFKPKVYHYSQAFNKGLKISNGKYIVKLSSDVVVLQKDFLQKMISSFVDQKVGATYGRYIITGKNPGYSYPYFWPAERFPKKMTRYTGKPNPFKMIFDKKHGMEVTNLAGGCCAISGDILRKRPLNEDLGGGEDAEYAWFLHVVGFDIVFNPEVKVIHEHKISRAVSNWISKDSILLFFSYVKYYFGKLLGKDPYKELFKDFCFQTE